MKKNATGQTIGAQMVSSSDGSAFTGTVSCYVTIDGGTQTAGSGTVAHEGNGYHSYAPTQAETNGDHIAVTFIGTGAIPATVQTYTTFPQSADVAAGVTVSDKTGFSLATAPPTAVQIRQEMDANSTKLANLDATVSSRMATFTYTAPPSAADIWNNATRTLSAFGFGVTVSTNNDKTGYALTQSFPSNFASLGITAGGKISGVVLTDTATTLTNNPGLTAQQVEDAVLDALTADHPTAGTVGAAIAAAGSSGDPWAATYTQLETYDPETAGGLIYKLNVGDPTSPVVVIPAPPIDADFCTCYLDTESLSGVKRANVTMQFRLSALPAVGTRALEASTITAVTDTSGRLEITLVRTDAIEPAGRHYLVTSADLGIANRQLTLTASTFSLTDWLANG